jgi:hypothetical protein
VSPAAGDIPTTEARIAEVLGGFVRPGRAAPAYVRRHLVEHAAAGGVLDGRVLTFEFLPYVDPARLRPLLSAAGPDVDEVLGM